MDSMQFWKISENWWADLQSTNEWWIDFTMRIIVFVSMQVVLCGELFHFAFRSVRHHFLDLRSLSLALIYKAVRREVLLLRPEARSELWWHHYQQQEMWSWRSREPIQHEIRMWHVLMIPDIEKGVRMPMKCWQQDQADWFSKEVVEFPFQGV